MRDPARVIANAIRDHAYADPGWDASHAAARAAIAALRDEYGSWRIPSGYLRTDGSEVDGTDVVIPVPAVAEETPHA